MANSITKFFNLIGESFRFSMASIFGDKFRAFLSLLGVTVGIFSIIAVFQAIDSLEDNIKKSFSVFGSDVVYVDKFAWENLENEGMSKWWEYRQRPSNTYNEFLYLRNNVKSADAFGFTVSTSSRVTNKRTAIKRASIYGITHEWIQISPFEIENGRYFTQYEAGSEQAVAIIGSKVAETLFPGQDPINQTLKIGNFTIRVIGTIKKQGTGSFTVIDYDGSVICPLNFMKNFLDFNKAEPKLVLHRREGVDREEFLAEIKMFMRNIRRLKPSQKDNFALNEVSFLQDSLAKVFTTLTLVGAIIGGFSILIGAFGIANIMFVSVKERTNLIGIQKSLGATNGFILSQFLFESIFLSILGGIIGIFLVWVLITIVSERFDFSMTLTTWNVLRGVLISTIVGLIAGFTPAYRAAKLDPVEAINNK